METSAEINGAVAEVETCERSGFEVPLHIGRPTTPSAPHLKHILPLEPHLVRYKVVQLDGVSVFLILCREFDGRIVIIPIVHEGDNTFSVFLADIGIELLCDPGVQYMIEFAVRDWHVQGVVDELSFNNTLVT